MKIAETAVKRCWNCNRFAYIAGRQNGSALCGDVRQRRYGQTAAQSQGRSNTTRRGKFCRTIRRVFF